MTKFLANVLLIGLSVSAQIAVMEYGWGLRPRSWGWIIGVGFFATVFLYALRDAVNKDDKK
jgi:hypothetical protein